MNFIHKINVLALEFISLYFTTRQKQNKNDQQEL